MKPLDKLLGNLKSLFPEFHNTIPIEFLFQQNPIKAERLKLLIINRSIFNNRNLLSQKTITIHITMKEK